MGERSDKPFVLFECPRLDAVTEAHGLGAELGVCAVVALVTGVGDAARQLQPPRAVAVRLLVRGEPVHAAREAGEVVHLVLQPPVLPLRDVGEAPGRLVYQVLLNVQSGLVKQSLGLHTNTGLEY